MPANITIKDYYAMLENHDWFYERSDNHSCYLKGRAAFQLVYKFAACSKQHRELFSAFKAHKESGPAFNSERLEKPACPE